MNMLEQLQSVSSYKAKMPVQRNTGAETRRKNHIAKYKAIFNGKQLTTGQIAQAADITPMGCINVLRRFEELGLVKRAGRRPTGGTNPTIVWEWVK